MGGVQVYPGAIDDWFQIFLVNKFQIPHPLPFQTLIVIQNIPSLGQSLAIFLIKKLNVFTSACDASLYCDVI